MRRLAAILALLLLASACGGGDGMSPSTSTASLNGIVHVGQSGNWVVGMTITIKDGANAGRTAITDSNGNYSFLNLKIAGQTVEAGAGSANFNSQAKGITLAPGANALNFEVLPKEVWSTSGAGDNVFDMPTWVRRVHVVGVYNGSSSNFIVRVGSQLLVNELIGDFWNSRRYEGTLLTSGGTVSITNSSGVQWSFDEVR